jgi:hypothetical protein
MSGHIYVRSFICQVIHMSGHIYVRSYICKVIHMSGHTYVRSYICQVIHMSGHTNVRSYKCQVIQMSGHTNVRSYKSQALHFRRRQFCLPFLFWVPQHNLHRSLYTVPRYMTNQPTIGTTLKCLLPYIQCLLLDFRLKM